MNLKYLLAAFASALSAAATALAEAAENCPEMIAGTVQELFAAGPTGNVTITDIANAELDGDGLPWDERIHSGGKTKTQKGVWARRKNIEDKVFNKIYAELRAKYPEAPETPAAVLTPPTPTGLSVPKAPGIPAPTVLSNYQKLVDWLAKNAGPGKAVTDEWVNGALAGSGTSLAALASDQTMSETWLGLFKQSLREAGITEVA